VDSAPTAVPIPASAPFGGPEKYGARPTTCPLRARSATARRTLRRCNDMPEAVLSVERIHVLSAAGEPLLCHGDARTKASGRCSGRLAVAVPGRMPQHSRPGTAGLLNRASPDTAAYLQDAWSASAPNRALRLLRPRRTIASSRCRSPTRSRPATRRRECRPRRLPTCEHLVACPQPAGRGATPLLDNCILQVPSGRLQRPARRFATATTAPERPAGRRGAP
jgi:hypothetical protein